MSQLKIKKIKNNKFLGEAIKNLTNTVEMGEEACDALDIQGEKIKNINEGYNKINRKLDFSERIISDMKSPYFKTPEMRKKNGTLTLNKLKIEGYVFKKGRKLNLWNKRYFILDFENNQIRYKINKFDPKIKGIINLNNSIIKIIDKGKKDSNGIRCNKNNAFEIIDKNTNISDTIYISKLDDYYKWISVLEPKKEEEKEKDQLDEVIDLLDNIYFISKKINIKADHQIDNIKEINKHSDKTSNRINKSIEKVKDL